MLFDRLAQGSTVELIEIANCLWDVSIPPQLKERSLHHQVLVGLCHLTHRLLQLAAVDLFPEAERPAEQAALWRLFFPQGFRNA